MSSPESDSAPCLAHLPAELMLKILASLSGDRQTLFKLLFLHPNYQVVVEQLLYQSMTCGPGACAQKGFLASVTNNPRLASYVIRFGIIQSSNGPTKSLEWNVILAALQNMVNLTCFVLSLPNPHGRIVYPASSILSILKNRRLEVFKWNVSFPTLEILSFLTTQPELHELLVDMAPCHTPALRSQENQAQSVSVNLPKLRRFTGNCTAIHAVMPHCPDVTSLGWRTNVRDGWHWSENTESQTSFANITSLSIEDVFKPIRDTLLKIVQVRCPALQCLQITFLPSYVEVWISTGLQLCE
ncbi:hypothetical protein CVT24_008508 [Panaeolus cyanescens]|uniref:F-box domain-containing protein n=1 Tax=Panaeolus cyanescens TaxID=181874 RepID=A0A409W4G7_9AGAR|nr:hypothetical protein CVT24_008508 [Panaeolus cyanescens]